MLGAAFGLPRFASPLLAQKARTMHAEFAAKIQSVNKKRPADPSGVWAQPFFQAMHRALKPGGVICTQARTAWTGWLCVAACMLTCCLLMCSCSGLAACFSCAHMEMAT